MNEDRTLVIEPNAKPPHLFVIFQGAVTEYTLTGEQIAGRPSKSGTPDISLPIETASRRHGSFSTLRGHSTFRDLGSTNGTVYNSAKLQPNSSVPLTDGDVLRITGRGDPTHKNDLVIAYSTGWLAGLTWKTLPLSNEIAEISIGREDALGLQNRAVSRHHASFFLASKGWAIIDHDSTNGVFVNGRRIRQPEYLRPMDVVSIAGYLFVFTGDSLLYQSDADIDKYSPVGRTITRSGGFLSINIEERNVWKRAKKKTLLKDIKLDIPSGSMVLILGGSGAGKTTFMNAVMGYEKADGHIIYKDMDIYAEYEKMKYEIGYVPQQDLLRMSDTVYDTVLNAAKMRLPAGLSEHTYQEAVSKTMNLLGLEREKDNLVGKLSGGQRKRLSIAVEYIGNPSLFFLDEPDSGLDGTMSRSLMENLRAIADEGKIVIVISHAPDRAFELFDKVIVLAKSDRDGSGHLVFYGSPKESCSFFDTEKLEGIVKRINRPDEGGDGKADYYIDRFAKMKGTYNG